MTTENKRLYVCNLPFSVTPLELKDIFETIGPVIFYNVIIDKELGRSRGFGFVEMEDLDDAKRAVKELHGSKYKRRTISVDFSRAPREKP